MIQNPSKERVKEAVRKKDETELWRIIFEERVLEMEVRRKYDGLVRLCHVRKTGLIKRKY